jgi:AraC-like DNA-binding protein
LHDSPTFLGIGRYSAERGHDFPRHSHSCWELVYYTRGPVQAIVGDLTFDAGPGTIVATPPGTPHEEIAVGAYANLHLAVDAPVDAGWPLIAHDDPSGRFGRIFRELLVESSESDGELLPALLAELDIRLRRSRVRPVQVDETVGLVARAEADLNRTLAEAPTLEHVARGLGVAPSTLRVAFLRVTGVPPSTRLAQLRVDAALAHLRTSSLTLESVARLTGYASASHLSRHVKKVTGLTPGAVRRSAAGDDRSAAQRRPLRRS